MMASDAGNALERSQAAVVGAQVTAVQVGLFEIKVINQFRPRQVVYQDGWLLAQRMCQRQHGDQFVFVERQVIYAGGLYRFADDRDVNLFVL